MQLKQCTQLMQKRNMWWNELERTHVPRRPYYLRSSTLIDSVLPTLIAPKPICFNFDSSRKALHFHIFIFQNKLNKFLEFSKSTNSQLLHSLCTPFMRWEQIWWDHNLTMMVMITKRMVITRKVMVMPRKGMVMTRKVMVITRKVIVMTKTMTRDSPDHKRPSLPPNGVLRDGTVHSCRPSLDATIPQFHCSPLVSCYCTILWTVVQCDELYQLFPIPIALHCYNAAQDRGDCVEDEVGEGRKGAAIGRQLTCPDIPPIYHGQSRLPYTIRALLRSNILSKAVT